MKRPDQHLQNQTTVEIACRITKAVAGVLN